MASRRPRVIDRPFGSDHKRASVRVECSRCGKRLEQVRMSHDDPKGWDGLLTENWTHDPVPGKWGSYGGPTRVDSETGGITFKYLGRLAFHCPRPGCGNVWQATDSDFLDLVRAANEATQPVRL